MAAWWRLEGSRAVAFFVGLLLFVVVIGVLDARLIPWPKPETGT